MTTGLTPKGYITPNGDDPVLNGDNVISTLAGQVDTRLGVAAAGTVTIASPVANTAYTAVVTFPAGRFTVAPFINLTAATSGPTQVALSYTIGGSTVSFTIYMQATTTANRVVSWHAIQV